MKVAGTDMDARAVAGYERQRSHEFQHDAKESTSNRSYSRSESDARANEESGWTKDVNGRESDYHPCDGGAYQRTDCSQTEGRTASHSTLR